MSTPDQVQKVFKMKPPSGEPFFAAIVTAEGGDYVISTRGGRWGPEDSIILADLVMPEQRLGEWDVDEIKDPGNAP